MSEGPVTVPALRARKRRNGDTPIVMVTAYDEPGARIVSEAGVDIILVGDSVANTVAVFSVASSGQLTPMGAPVSTGTTPVSVCVSPSGKFLFTANQGSNNVSTFSIDSSGALMKLTDTLVSPGAAPSYVTTDASGSLLFVANRDSNSISVLSIDSSGTLKQVTGSGSLFVNQPAAVASLN